MAQTACTYGIAQTSRLCFQIICSYAGLWNLSLNLGIRQTNY